MQEYFRNTEQKEYDEYIKILKKVIEIIINNDVEDYKLYDLEKITVIDDGDYQGTQIFIIPRNTYKPSIEDYIYTHNYYGSCSGCDTLQAIHEYEYGLPNEEQVKAYMKLSLHLLQNMKQFTDDICLHCNEDTPIYCEKCYQELISKNAELQLENKHSLIATKLAVMQKQIDDSIPKQAIRDKIYVLEKLQKEFKNNEELRIKIITYKELLNKGE